MEFKINVTLKIDNDRLTFQDLESLRIGDFSKLNSFIQPELKEKLITITNTADKRNYKIFEFVKSERYCGPLYSNSVEFPLSVEKDISKCYVKDNVVYQKINLEEEINKKITKVKEEKEGYINSDIKKIEELQNKNTDFEIRINNGEDCDCSDCSYDIPEKCMRADIKYNIKQIQNLRNDLGRYNELINIIQEILG